MSEKPVIISVEEQYQNKSEIDHVLDRSGTWVGSIYNDLKTAYLYKPSANKMVLIKDVPFNDGLLKIIDEVITNSIDEFRRPNALFKISEIDVFVGKGGLIRVRDNGGIRVEEHKETGMYVPQMIFGNMRTSSNYNDAEQREWAGTNGLGAKLTNIFSTSFKVTTADTKNKMEIEWRNNMKEIHSSVVEPSKEHFTEIEFQIELERFGIKEFSAQTIHIIQKRVIDAAAVNTGLKINFATDMFENNKLNSSFVFDNFEEYINMYIGSPENYPKIPIYTNKKDYVVIIPVLDNTLSFVNGVLCSEGTHIRKIRSQVEKHMVAWCEKNDMELITDRDVSQRFAVFANITVVNPTYSSQTKEKLTNKIDSQKLVLPKQFLKKLEESNLAQSLKDFFVSKYAAEKRKEQREMNKQIKSIESEKLIKCDPRVKGSKELWVFEGASAGKGFRQYRNRGTQAGYLLRGKVRNTINVGYKTIYENREFSELMAVCNLQFGEPEKNLKNFPFDKVIIATDADQDGAHINGLLLVFFATHFPELLKAGKIYRAESPLVVVSKLSNPSDRNYYYSLKEFSTVENNFNKSYEINYCKGLGSLEDIDYKELLENQRLIKFDYNEEDKEAVIVWFDTQTNERKKILMEDNISEDDVA